MVSCHVTLLNRAARRDTSHDGTIHHPITTPKRLLLMISGTESQFPYYEKPQRSRCTPRRSPNSPQLRSANSLNFPPLYPVDIPLGSPPAQISPPNGYISPPNGYTSPPNGCFPPPPDVPYAESAASSTYSVPEEEEGFPQLAEDEKRKRNLAASARFRQKKKQREQQLEKATKQLNDQADELEARITELEQENELLKAMLTEKVDTMTEDDRRRFDKVADELEV
ncbi:BZIP transcription factor [Venturia nashicola]|uniref:BZIP transcription factor n=1 Tax=Venturia nashicola TaxID=86259 RepID=A0A4Z1P3G3_9PEZI|nr:BZIP transcription factor [Venturia nashicola]